MHTYIAVYISGGRADLGSAAVAAAAAACLAKLCELYSAQNVIFILRQQRREIEHTRI